MTTFNVALLATEAATSGGGGNFIKGVAITVAFIVVFVGSVWLLTSMILGAKLGYYVTGACLFAVMTMLSLIWFVTALGPKGEEGFWGDLGTETAWHPVAAGPDLKEAEAKWGTWDVGDFPDGEGWEEPEDDAKLADVDSLGTELANADPVMEALVADAVSEIPGVREDVKEMVKGELALDPEKFTITDVKMKEVNAAGKDTVLAVGNAVATEQVMSGDLGGKAEGTVSKFLVEKNTQVTPGTPVMEVESEGQITTLNSDKTGRLVEFGFRKDDKIKPNVPFATIDMTGQPGAPDDARVAAVRVRGSVRVPAFIYLMVSLALMILHLRGVSKTEKEARLGQPQIA